MAATRFPGMPEGAAPVMFTAFCPCGGTMVLAILEDAPPPGPPEGATSKKPWWKIW